MSDARDPRPAPERNGGDLGDRARGTARDGAPVERTDAGFAGLFEPGSIDPDLAPPVEHGPPHRGRAARAVASGGGHRQRAAAPESTVDAEAQAEADRIALLQAIGFQVEPDPVPDAPGAVGPFEEPGQARAGGATAARLPESDAPEAAEVPTEVLLAPEAETRVLPAAELGVPVAGGAAADAAETTEVLPAVQPRRGGDVSDPETRLLPAVGSPSRSAAVIPAEAGPDDDETEDLQAEASGSLQPDPVPVSPVGTGNAGRAFADRLSVAEPVEHPPVERVAHPDAERDAPAAAAAAAAATTAPPAVAATAQARPVDATVAEPADEHETSGDTVLRIDGLTKRFGRMVAVDDIHLAVSAGSFYGIVGPNGAGKTTTLSMVTGLLRPDAGTVQVHGIDVWRDPEHAKRAIGVLPDALRLFDRLTGAQLLYYSGVLRGLDGPTVKARSADLVSAFGLEDATRRVVADYSAGMTKKIALAAAMIHSPRLLVLDEPFESVDPVSAANIIDILERYVASGGTVVLSSHGMDLIQRVCDHVAVIIGGRVLAAGTTDEVRGEQSLEDRFVELAGGRKAAEGMEWLHSFSD